MRFQLTLAFLLATSVLSQAGVVVRFWYEDITTKYSYAPVIPVPKIGLEIVPTVGPVIAPTANPVLFQAIDTFNSTVGSAVTVNRFPDMPTGSTLMSLYLEDQEGLQEVTSGGNNGTVVATVVGSNDGTKGLHNNYMAFVRGFIEAPQTGNYTFWVAADDAVEFRLSADHTPAKLTGDPIAFHGIPSVGFRSWEVRPEQRSNPVFLERGKKYYFELRHFEGPGRDRVSVGWQLPDGSYDRPISGKYLAPFPLTETLVPNPPGEAFPRYVPKTSAPPTILGPAYFRYPLNGQPASNTVARFGEPANFSVTYEASQPAYLQWRRNGQPITNGILASYSTPPVTATDHGAVFDVVITNAFGSITSNPAILYVDQADLPSLTVVSAATRGNPTGVEVNFSKPVDKTTAETVANYTLNIVDLPAAPVVVNVTSAKLVGANTVRLSANLPEGHVYRVLVSGVNDKALGSPMQPGTAQFLQVHGAVEFRAFFNIQGNTVADLTATDRFKNNQPDRTYYLGELGTSLNPFQTASDYGGHFRGYITAPVTGPYVFAIAADNQGAFNLSTDENPANARPLLAESAPHAFRDYNPVTAAAPAVNQTDPAANVGVIQNYPATVVNTQKMSAPIVLTAGKKYYFEAFYKENGAGDDHLSIAWQKPGDPPIVPAAQRLAFSVTNVTPGAAPIGPEYLSAFGVTSGDVTLVSAPAARTVNELDPVDFLVKVDGSPRYFYQWYRNGEPILNATNAAYHVAAADRSDDGARFSVTVRNGFSSVTSPDAKLTVVYDGIPPSLLSAIQTASGDRVIAHFSEAITPASANNTANYQLDRGGVIQRAELLASGTDVALVTSPLQQGQQYTLTATGIQDRSPGNNTIAANNSAKFTAWKLTSGAVQVEYFTGIPGEECSDLTASPKFPQQPDEVSSATRLATRRDYGDNYGARISGFIIPPADGSYVFYLRSSNTSVFYLSSTSSPDGLSYTPDAACPFSVPDFRTEASTQPFDLKAGERYYFEALMKAGVGPDYFEIAMRESNDTTPLSDLQPVPSSSIASFLNPDAASSPVSLSISRLPSRITVSWPPEALGWELQTRGQLGSGSWAPVPNSRNVNSLSLDAPYPNSGFFRLVK